jgi:hypothetical protein
MSTEVTTDATDCAEGPGETPTFRLTGIDVTLADFTNPDTNVFRLTGERIRKGVVCETSKGTIARYQHQDADNGPSFGYHDWPELGPDNPAREGSIGHIPPPREVARMFETVERFKHEPCGVVELRLSEGADFLEWAAIVQDRPHFANRLAGLVPGIAVKPRPQPKLMLGTVLHQQRFHGSKVYLDSGIVESIVLRHANAGDLEGPDPDDESSFLIGLMPLEVRNAWSFRNKVGVVRHEYDVDQETAKRVNPPHDPNRALKYVVQTSVRLNVTLVHVGAR